MEKEGAFYLFSLRLIPAVPFFVLNLVMGLTPIRVWTYWWVGQIGMLAGTMVYVSAGASVPSLSELTERGMGQHPLAATHRCLRHPRTLPHHREKIMGWVRSRRETTEDLE